MIRALEVVATAPVASFRNPLYAGVQLGLPCPPPATIGGLLAAAAGGWHHVSTDLRFAATFFAAGSGTDLETYHPLLASGKPGSPTPKDREFLAGVELRLWLLDDVDGWQRTLRRPVWPLRLGRSQDLADVRAHVVDLEEGPGRQGSALLPSDVSRTGALLQLPTAVSADRTRTRWDAYRYASQGADTSVEEPDFVTRGGQAVVLLPPAHPDQLTEARPRLHLSTRDAATAAELGSLRPDARGHPVSIRTRRLQQVGRAANTTDGPLQREGLQALLHPC